MVDKYHSLSNLVSLDNQPTKLTNKYSLEENKERDTKNDQGISTPLADGYKLTKEREREYHGQ